MTAGTDVDRPTVHRSDPGVAAARRSDARHVRPFALVTAFGVALGVALVALDVAMGVSAAEMLPRYTFTNAAFAWTFVPVAGLILSRHPRHRVGWIMLWIGLLAPAQILADKLSELLAPAGASFSEWPVAVQVLAWIPIWFWVPAVFPMFLLLPLYFPDGRLPSPRWRIVRWAAYAFIVVLSVAFAGGFWLWADPAITDATFATATGASAFVDGTTPLAALVEFVFPLFVPVVIAVVASVVVRYRRASATERDQVRWLLFGVALAAPVMTAALLAMQFVGEPPWVFVALTLAVVPIPVTMGVAILRHRLFDIDVVISRSLTAAGLALFITAVYIGVVVGVGSLVGSGDRTDLGLQVVATAIVAVAFQPVRRRLRQWTDRLVFGHRATPYEVLAEFSRTAAQTATDDSLPSIARLLAIGTGAQPATVWLRVGDELRRAATASKGPAAAARPAPSSATTASLASGAVQPAPSSATTVPLGSDERLPALPADAVTPVVHDGRLLGALAVAKPRGEQVTEQDRDLLDRLAAGVALVLRNVALTEELRARLDDLVASRQRLVHAQDDARRRLERDLREGAHRRLVTLEAELSAARAAAGAVGAVKTGVLVDQIAADVDAAVATLRELAGGIYPPLLEADGLGPALEDQARRAALPVTVDADGVGRFTRDVEVSVYFCVLEALQNAAKYADAASATVRLECDDAALRFTVSDDGRGFDPATTSPGSGLQGMADRLDTVGGSLDVTSAPGGGTTVLGVVPVRPDPRTGGHRRDAAALRGVPTTSAPREVATTSAPREVATTSALREAAT